MPFFKSLAGRFKDGGAGKGSATSSDLPDLSKFRYQPLNASKREVRIILAISPWNAGTASFDHHPRVINDLHVFLTTVSLNDKPSYHPISYAWSKGKPMREVYVDTYPKEEQGNLKAKRRYPQHPLGQKKLKIPEDVYEFLRFKVSAATSERHNPNVGWSSSQIWIDQICINQDDLKEAANQVRLMDKIYFHPNTTIIWFGFTGEYGGDGELAVQFVDRIDHDFFARLVEQAALPSSRWPQRAGLPPEHGIIEDPLNPRYWKALRAFLLRTWWSRTWIIQEALLSRIGLITCGRAQTILYKFAILHSQFLKAHANHHVMPPYVRHVFRGIPFTEFLARFQALTIGFGSARLSRSETRKADDELTLLPLMSFASTAGLTKHQDRIYGLLGLCAKRYQENIHVDYEIPVPTAMLQAFMYIIPTAGLGALQLGKLVKGDNMGLPSWMPDLGTTSSSGQWLLEFPDRYYLGQGIFVHPWTADGKSSEWTALGLPDWTLPTDDVTPSNVCAKFSRDHRIMACRGIRFDTIAKIMPTNLFSTQEIESSIHDMQDLQLDYSKTQRLQELASFVMAHDINPYPDKIFAFWRTLYLNRSHEKKKLPDFSAAGKYPQEMSFDRLSAHSVQRVAMNLNERSFLVTTSGYFGIGPPMAREGDIVCVIQTAHVPFVIRHVTGREYQFIGDSYVHDISEGEILGWARTNRVAIEEFWIR